MTSHYSGLTEVEIASYSFPCDKTIIGMEVVVSASSWLQQTMVICSFELPTVVILEDMLILRADEERLCCFPQELLEVNQSWQQPLFNRGNFW